MSSSTQINQTHRVTTHHAHHLVLAGSASPFEVCCLPKYNYGCNPFLSGCYLTGWIPWAHISSRIFPRLHRVMRKMDLPAWKESNARRKWAVVTDKQKSSTWAFAAHGGTKRMVVMLADKDLVLTRTKSVGLRSRFLIDTVRTSSSTSVMKKSHVVESKLVYNKLHLNLG